VRKLLAIVQDRIPKRFGFDPLRNIQVLCPMNRGGLGARSLNVELQKVLNPPGEIRIERFGWTFCPGDKVMQIENDYDREVYYGDLGLVSRIDIEEGEIAVDFEAARSSTALANSTNWCSLTRRRSTRARVLSTPLS
jgi:exodeoxyribonuclease V alpha subunit